MKDISNLTTIVIDSSKLEKSVLKEIEDILYGTDSTPPTLPSIQEIYRIVSRNTFHSKLVEIMTILGNALWNPSNSKDEAILNGVKELAYRSVYFESVDGRLPDPKTHIFPCIRYELITNASTEDGKKEYLVEGIDTQSSISLNTSLFRQLRAMEGSTDTGIGNGYDIAGIGSLIGNVFKVIY